MPHIQRVEDMPLDIVSVCFTTGGLDDQPQYVVVCVAVLKLGSHGSVELECCQRAHLVLSSIRLLVKVAEACQPSEVGMPLVWFSMWRTVICADACGSATRNQGR